MACIRLIIIFLLCTSEAYSAESLSDAIGYSWLEQELGDAIPTGKDVKVAQIEAGSKGNYAPNLFSKEFAGTEINLLSGESGKSSGHANMVARHLYGNKSLLSPGVVQVDSYSSNDWLNPGFLKVSSPLPPDYTDARVANHSWVGGMVTGTATVMALRRMDFVVDADDFINVVGVNNGNKVMPLFSSAYNVIAVGTTRGKHAISTPDLGPVYVYGRVKPDLVVPEGVTSKAAPLVAAGASLLIELGRDNPQLSTGTIRTPYYRTNRILQHAETAEVIRAALMAGANRDAITLAENGHKYTTDTQNNLNKRFGAGQMDIYQSYHIIAAGEQEPGDVEKTGFDYMPAFGGDYGSSRKAEYSFTAEDDGEFIACLVYHFKVGYRQEGPVYEDTLFRLHLQLVDTTGEVPMVISSSQARWENTQNLKVDLKSGHSYTMRVTVGAEQDPFKIDYGLAWRVIPKPAD